MKKIFLVLTILLLSACGSNITEYKSGSEIVAVYFHEHNTYSVAVKTGNELKMVRLPNYILAKIVTDVVLPSEPMWYRCDATLDHWTNSADGLCEIHIRSVDDIGGAGWNHGKFGRGTTTRVD